MQEVRTVAATTFHFATGCTRQHELVRSRGEWSRRGPNPALPSNEIPTYRLHPAWRYVNEFQTHDMQQQRKFVSPQNRGLRKEQAASSQLLLRAPFSLFIAILA